MKYTLILNIDGIAVCKSITYATVSENEIEITEDQYNQINEFPIKLTLDENGQVISWEKTELPQTEYVEPVHEPTIEERLKLAEDTILYLLMNGGM